MMMYHMNQIPAKLLSTHVLTKINIDIEIMYTTAELPKLAIKRAENDENGSCMNRVIAIHLA